jgi:opacity protein-like surface antigen
MKKKIGFAGVMAAFVLVSPNMVSGSTSLPGGNGNAGFYMAADAGVNLASDMTISPRKIIGGPVPVYIPGLAIPMSTGSRVDISSGYAFKLSDQFTLAPEVEAGFIYNQFSDFDGLGSHCYMQVPLMANVVLNWHFAPGWAVYAGGGAGSDYSWVNNIVIGGASLGKRAEGEFDFAWQGMAGIRYAFGSSEVGLGYKYLAVQPFGFETMGNNAIFLSYTFHF